jgi:hypothetical protein
MGFCIPISHSLYLSKAKIYNYISFYRFHYCVKKFEFWQRSGSYCCAPQVMEIGDVSCLYLHSQRAIWAVAIIYVSQHSLCLLKVKKDLNSYGRQYSQSQQYEPLLCPSTSFTSAWQPVKHVNFCVY